MNPSEYCEVIVKKIKESNLHNILNENAFSIQIKIKKKFIDEKPRSAAKNKLKESSDLHVKNETQKVFQGNGLAFHAVRESYPLQHISSSVMSQSMSIITTPCLNLNMSIHPPPVSQIINNSNSFAFEKLGNSSHRRLPEELFNLDKSVHKATKDWLFEDMFICSFYLNIILDNLTVVESHILKKKNSPTTTNSNNLPTSEYKTPFQTITTWLSLTPTMTKETSHSLHEPNYDQEHLSLHEPNNDQEHLSLSMNPTLTNTFIPSLHPCKTNITSTSQKELETNNILLVSQPRPHPPSTPQGQPPESPSTTVGSFFF